MSSRSKIGLLLAPLVGLGACNALLGVEDVHLRDEPTGVAGDGGPSGSSSGGSGGSTSGGSGSGGSSSGGSGSGGSGHGGTSGHSGQSGVAGSPLTDAGADGIGGAPGGAGEPTGGMPGGAGEATGGAGGSALGSGGAGGAGGEPDLCPALGEEKPVHGPLTLVQFAPHPDSRGRLNVSPDGKSAYATRGSMYTQHFTRDVLTGKLTPKSTCAVYNGEFSALSPSSRHLFVGGVNGLQFYKIPLAVDGSIADTNANVPPSYKPPLDALVVGDSTILLPSGDSIRAIENDVYDPTNRLPGAYDGMRGLSRAGRYLYWTEYANQVQFPNGTPKVGRARFECDGTLGPREAFTTGIAPWDVAASDKTGFVYVPHAALAQDKPGWLDVVDLSTCVGDFSSCIPIKKLTSADIPGLFSPSGVRISTDGSTLFLSSFSDTGGGGVFLVLSLANPAAPEVIQTFEPGKTYDGVKLTGKFWAWHLTFFDGYLYVPMELGDGIAVFKSKE